MLERFGLTEKILAVNADNATSNDTQTTKLDKLDNSFKEANRVRCFNHTLQLSAKALLKPFNTAISPSSLQTTMAAQDVDDDNKQHMQTTRKTKRGEEEEEEEEGVVEDDVEDDNIDELQELSEDERERVLEETAVVRETVSKVRYEQKMFAVFVTNSTYRCDNCRSPSFILPPSLSLLGAASAVSSNSKNGSSPVTS
jgi:hypothetical protein